MLFVTKGHLSKLDSITWPWRCPYERETTVGLFKRSGQKSRINAFPLLTFTFVRAWSIFTEFIVLTGSFLRTFIDICSERLAIRMKHGEEGGKEKQRYPKRYPVKGWQWEIIQVQECFFQIMWCDGCILL